AVFAGVRAPPAAGPQPAAQERKDTSGAGPATGRAGPAAAGVGGFRGRALERPDFARAARSRRRAGPQLARAADRDVPPRVSSALDRPAAGDHADPQSP